MNENAPKEAPSINIAKYYKYSSNTIIHNYSTWNELIISAKASDNTISHHICKIFQLTILTVYPTNVLDNQYSSLMLNNSPWDKEIIPVLSLSRHKQQLSQWQVTSGTGTRKIFLSCAQYNISISLTKGGNCQCTHKIWQLLGWNQEWAEQSSPVLCSIESSWLIEDDCPIIFSPCPLDGPILISHDHLTTLWTFLLPKINWP